MTNTGTAISFPAHFIGDLVRLVPSARGKYGSTVFRVTDIPGGRRTKTSVEPLDGGLGLKGNPWLFESVPAEEVSRILAALPVVDAPSLVVGSTVKMAGKAEVFVVIKVAVGKFNVAALGGDSGRFYRSVPARLLTPFAV